MSRSWITLQVLLVSSLVRAQGEGDLYSGPGMPRWSVGLEVLQPLVQLIADEDEERVLSIAGGTQYREGREWRIGYGYDRETENARSVWTVEDTLGRLFLTSAFQRVHQGAFGHQWYFGRGRFRPFLGTDLIVAYQESQYLEEEITFQRDTSSSGTGWVGGAMLEYTSEWRYREYVKIGPALAGGLDIRLHRHLSVQLRMAWAWLFAVTLSEQGEEPYLDHGSSQGSGLQLGSGLFVRFQF